MVETPHPGAPGAQQVRMQPLYEVTPLFPASMLFTSHGPAGRTFLQSRWAKRLLVWGHLLGFGDSQGGTVLEVQSWAGGDGGGCGTHGPAAPSSVGSSLQLGPCQVLATRWEGAWLRGASPAFSSYVTVPGSSRSSPTWEALHAFPGRPLPQDAPPRFPSVA